MNVSWTDAETFAEEEDFDSEPEEGVWEDNDAVREWSEEKRKKRQVMKKEWRWPVHKKGFCATCEVEHECEQEVRNYRVRIALNWYYDNDEDVEEEELEEEPAEVPDEGDSDSDLGTFKNDDEVGPGPMSRMI